MKRFGQAGAAGVVEIVPVVTKVISDCCQGGPSIYSFIAGYGSFQCSDIDGIHGPFYRPAKVGGAVSLLALFEFEAPTCLKQLNEIACTVATWVEIAVIGPQIECDT